MDEGKNMENVSVWVHCSKMPNLIPKQLNCSCFVIYILFTWATLKGLMLIF